MLPLSLGLPFPAQELTTAVSGPSSVNLTWLTIPSSAETEPGTGMEDEMMGLTEHGETIWYITLYQEGNITRSATHMGSEVSIDESFP